MDVGSGLQTRVIVRRTLEADIKARDLYVLLDDEPERTVLFPKTLEIEIAPGEHRLKVTNRVFSREATFQASPGETIVFLAGNIVRGGIFGMIAAALTAAYTVTLERADGTA